MCRSYYKAQDELISAYEDVCVSQRGEEETADTELSKRQRLIALRFSQATLCINLVNIIFYISIVCRPCTKGLSKFEVCACLCVPVCLKVSVYVYVCVHICFLYEIFMPIMQDSMACVSSITYIKSVII